MSTAVTGATGSYGAPAPIESPNAAAPIRPSLVGDSITGLGVRRQQQQQEPRSRVACCPDPDKWQYPRHAETKATVIQVADIPELGLRGVPMRWNFGFHFAASAVFLPVPRERCLCACCEFRQHHKRWVDVPREQPWVPKARAMLPERGRKAYDELVASRFKVEPPAGEMREDRVLEVRSAAGTGHLSLQEVERLYGDTEAQEIAKRLPIFRYGHRADADREADRYGSGERNRPTACEYAMTDTPYEPWPAGLAGKITWLYRGSVVSTDDCGSQQGLPSSEFAVTMEITWHGNPIVPEQVQGLVLRPKLTLFVEGSMKPFIDELLKEPEDSRGRTAVIIYNTYRGERAKPTVSSHDKMTAPGQMEKILGR